MSKISELLPSFEAWKQSRPINIQAMITKCPPNLLYLLVPTGQRVTIHSYNEDGTVTVNYSGDYNYITTFERQVFGVALVDLEECDLPTVDERLGAPTQAQQHANIEEAKKEYIRKHQ